MGDDLPRASQLLRFVGHGRVIGYSSIKAACRSRDTVLFLTGLKQLSTLPPADVLGSEDPPGVKLPNLRASKQFTFQRQRVSRRGSLQRAQRKRRHDDERRVGPISGRISAIVPPRVARTGFSSHHF
jgi:hypothetical protein